MCCRLCIQIVASEEQQVGGGHNSIHDDSTAEQVWAFVDALSLCTTAGCRGGGHEVGLKLAPIHGTAVALSKGCWAFALGPGRLQVVK